MQIKCHYYEINFNLIQLPKDSVLHAIDLCHNLYSRVVTKINTAWILIRVLNDISIALFSVHDIYGLKSVLCWEARALCFGTNTCWVPFCAEEEINLPTVGNCAHANRFEKPFFILYGVVSSKSLFENRQTLTFISELWHCGAQMAVLFSSPALCSGSALPPRRQF